MKSNLLKLIKVLAKLSIYILLVVFINPLFASSYGQGLKDTKISINIKQGSIIEVFEHIESQSSFRFLYDNKIKDGDEKLSIHNEDVTIYDVLQFLSQEFRLKFKRINNSISVTRIPEEVRKPEPPVVIEVTGKVIDETGAPLPGATVLEKGTTNGVITDFDGNFAIEVNADATLKISFLGYSAKEVSVNGQSEITIQLEPDATLLDDVVVVGYGTQKKVNLTGAVSQVSGEDFEQRPVTQLTQALQGAIPNLNVTFGSGRPGSSGSVNVRGTTSINGGGPLILIDGVLGTLDRINVNDVESVTVLKDASAAAVYGARGAFGVILVTTKSAREGKTNITYTTNLSYTTHAVNTDFITSGYWNAKITDEAMYNALGYRTTRYSEEDYAELWARVNDKTEHPERPWVVVKQNASGQDMYRYYGNFDWFNYLYNDKRPKQEHNLTISGGNEKTRYSLTGSYSKEQGIFNISPDYYKRNNLRSKVQSELKDWLTVSNNTHFFKSSYDWHGLSTNFNTVSNNVSNDPVYQYHPAYVPRNPDGTLTGYSGVNSYPIGYGLHNALESGTMKGYNNGTELTNTTEAVFKLAEGLTVTANYSYREYRTEYSYRSTPQYYSKFPGVMERHNLAALSSDRLNEHMTKTHWNFINVFGNYETNFGDHHLSVTAGFNQEDRTYKLIGGIGDNLLSETLNDLNLVVGNKQFKGGANEWAVRGGFYRANYNFAGKYLFEASGRYDGTSRFPQRSRFGFFPSFSAGWRLSEEPFFDKLRPVINNLKIRASYGSLGNQEVDTYSYISSMGTGQINYGVDSQRLPVTNAPSPVANTLTWESITTSNLGLDINMLKNRLSVEADFYIRDTRDMLSLGQKLPGVFGATEPRVNAADLRTKGFDLAIGWNDQFELAGKPFSYNVRGVLSDYVAHITKFENPDRHLSSHYEGKRWGEIWGYSYDGFFKTTEEAQAWASIVNQDQINVRRVQAPTEELRMLQAGDIKILDLNGDGIINTGANTLDDPGDRKVIGNSLPRYSYGLTLGANWNGIDMTVLFQGVGKQNWYPNLEAQAFWSVYARPYHSFIPVDFPGKVWSPENPDAYFPFLRGYTAQNAELSVPNDMYLQDLAYLKLRNLTIGYTLPQRWMDRIKVTRLRVYVGGENLHTWTKLKTDYMDPEEVMSDPTGRTYPMGRTYSCGLQVTF
ncbi:SusC/RagA family TonB-linked outer membrane protein [Sinomicrobium soli]|uniref:SusC/RagA family TonB-linked outer membrane protein n=1 Tax=Sinomicrobium sp. N-1-3-6 TaxID=2219864 RepID=UPI000DCAEACF|nr:TonB-dependent receptor [Sinomicrobium sp. N-1-3-6]RAV27794.1 SusC/RagA family TonB-linked outer membrane protein [Sinomicrobium sp. N-1-3-6]